jgi:cytokinin riboside 5'-monophosphate phosphoribohydrolase
MSTHRARHVFVYCSSSAAVDEAHVAFARGLGSALADRGDVLVWGGATAGLMGEVARATRLAGGRTIGVIPESLVAVEIADQAADELIVTPDMLSRKAEMAARADAFVALPGGFGTLEELMEQLTARLLGFHRKPIVLADVDGFWQPLLAVFEHLYTQRFARPESRAAYTVASDVVGVLDAVDRPAATLPGKWL